MKTAGIDVGHDELEVVLLLDGKRHQARRFGNHATDHQQIVKLLRGKRVGRVCVEATGTYHIDIAVALSRAEGIEVMVVNPKAVKHYAEAQLSRQKTDLEDAFLLADYAQRMAFTAWCPPPEAVLQVRAAARRLHALTRQRTEAKNQHHAYGVTGTTPAFVLEDIEHTIHQFDGQIERLKQQTLALIRDDADLCMAFDLLCTTKGVAQTSAIRILGELAVFPMELTDKQWVAMAGLDPRHHISGASVKRQTRISKAGNKYLRGALYMPALAATQHDPYVRAYYRHLIENRGLKKIQALCAVMRKLLHAFHGMLKNRQPFDNTRFFNAEAAGAT